MFSALPFVLLGLGSAKVWESLEILSAFLLAQLVKNPPAIWETWVRFLGLEDPLEKGKATYSSILACRIPWTAWSMGLQKVWHDWSTFTFTWILQISSLWIQSWNMMLWKCCTQYVSKFGELSSGHGIGKSQFSLHYQRKAMLNNAQTTSQLHSSQKLVK